MKYLLDTNIVSELQKGDKGDSSVRRWALSADKREFAVSVLVFGEIRRGIELKRRKDKRQARHLDRWYSSLKDDFAGRTLVVDDSVVEAWAMLDVPDRMPTVDGLIAATALVHSLVVVTRNTADFERRKIAVFNPFIG